MAKSEEFDRFEEEEEGKNLPAVREEMALEQLEEIDHGAIVQKQFGLWARPMTFSEEETQILQAPADPNDVEITGDGRAYVEWPKFQERFFKAFKGDYVIVPDPNHPQPYREGDSLVWGFYLIIHGQVRDYALGGAKLIRDNKVMSWDDVAEMAKSNVIKRFGKRLGMYSELWTRSWVKKWKEQFAERRGSGWDKKGKVSPPPQNGGSSQNPLKTTKEDVTEDEMKEFIEIMHEEYNRLGHTPFMTVLKALGVKNTKELTDKKRQEEAKKLLKVMQPPREPGEEGE